MAYRATLHALEWLAVSAATALLALSVADASAIWIASTGLALICASLLRGLALRRMSADRFDVVLSTFRASAPGRAVNDDGGAA